MTRMKKFTLAAVITLALAAGVAANPAASPAAQPIAGQRIEWEDHSGVRAALRQDPTLLNQPEPQDNAEVAGARRRLADMY